MSLEKIDDILNSRELFFTPADIAPLLHCDPQQIRIQARHDPNKLGFPVIVTGRRVRIPRKPFLHYLGIAEHTLR